MQKKDKPRIQFSNKLIWPENVKHMSSRILTKRKSTWLLANKELEKVVILIGVLDVVVTANLNVVLGHNIHSTRKGEKGVSVLYTPVNPMRRSKTPLPRKIAYCDIYVKPADNLLAIVKTLKAYKAIRKMKVGFMNYENQKI